MKATDSLLADHKMIRKILSQCNADNPRLPSVLQTLHRTVVGHAWFEDQIFLPALYKDTSLLKKIFLDEISQEHEDIAYFLQLIRKTPIHEKEFNAVSRQLFALLDTHFKKEEDALFPLAEQILDSEGLNQLNDEMKRQQSQIRNLVKD